MPSQPRHKNRLAQETSPYLLQHAENPVDWYPWGEEALARARNEDKPIFLSVGYSACHWCHVMERECFENQQIAELMNTRYVNIKVDREERPDIDEIYMQAVTAMTGAGGWPMSVFLTPELEPFYGATYLPPVRAYGRPSFPDVLVGLADAFRTEREEVVAQAKELARHIEQSGLLDARGTLDIAVLERSLAASQERFDPSWGGFGPAPKFPHSSELRLLLRHALRTDGARALSMATFTLDRMAAGGIYDQLGGGFHRYSVDREWRVPHFEKMLYDNAQLVVAYLEAFTLTKEPRYARIATESCDWALREMQTESGGFASAQDADSEGEEGRFFVWTKSQLEAVLGAERAKHTAAYFEVTETGNFEHGKNVLFMPSPREGVAESLGLSLAELEASVASAKRELLSAREKRVRPNTDDKVLAGWNGLLVSALSQACQVLGDVRYLHAAERAMRFVLTQMRQADGRLFATARAGRSHLNACLDDYAFVTQGLIDLYETSFDATWLKEALALVEVVETRFADTERGGYFTTGSDHEALIARLKSVHDGALPSGAAVHALNLRRLADLTLRTELQAKAKAAVDSLAALASRHPAAFSQLLIALDYELAPPRQIVVTGEVSDPRTQALLASVRSARRPQRVVALATADSDRSLIALTRDKNAGLGGPRAYVCESFTCQAPTDSVEELLRLLNT